MATDLFALQATMRLDTSEYTSAIDEAVSAGQQLESAVTGAFQEIDASAGILGTSMANASGDVQEYNREIEDTGENAERADNKLDFFAGIVGTVATAFANAEGPIGGVADLIGGALTGNVGQAAEGFKKLAEWIAETVKQTAERGDAIDKESQKMGISAERYQEWDFIAQHSGTTVQSLRRGMMNVADAMDSVRAASEKTIDTAAVEKAASAYDSAKQNVTDMYTAYQTAVEKYGEGSDQAAAAAQKIEDAYAKMDAAEAEYQQALQGTTPEINAQAQAIENLGVSMVNSDGSMRDYGDVMDEVIAALQGVDDATTRAKLAQDVFGRGYMELNPLLNQSAEDTDALREKMHEMGGVMSDELTQKSAAYEDALLDMQTASKGFTDRIAGVFMPAFTGAMNLAANAIGGVNAVMDYLGGAVEKGVEAAKSAFGKLDKVPEFFRSMWDSITKGAGKFIETAAAWGGNIILNLRKGVAEKFSDLYDGIKTIGLHIRDYFKGMWESALTWGHDLITNFTNGIVEFASKPFNAISDMLSGLKRLIGFSEPEEGPLSDFHTYAPDMMALFAKGISDNEGLITDAIGSAFNFGPQLAMSGAGAMGGQEIVVPRVDRGGQRDITIVLELDGLQFGRAVYKANNEETQRVGVKIETGGAY
jgi:uncharacterized protein with GYD domain